MKKSLTANHSPGMVSDLVKQSVIRRLDVVQKPI